jgi:hypothetical protein
MRDVRSITSHISKFVRESKEKLLWRNLRKEVEVGANGTQSYVIKNGANAGKIANKDKFQ